MNTQTNAVTTPSRFPLGLVIIIALLGSLVSGYFYLNGVRNTAVGYETRLSAQYLDNQNHLSAFISGFYEMVGVANLKSDKLDKILVDAVKGRYDKGGFGAGGSLFNAIHEAYPDLSGLNVYDKVADYIAAQRESYRAIQSKLLDMLRGFDNWRQLGFLRSFVVESVLGVPSKRLSAKVGDQALHGEDALKKMYQIVLTEDAVKAYQSGRMAPLSVK
jgi:hypothetical protein